MVSWNWVLAVGAAIVIVTGPVLAGEYRLGSLTIKEPYARATPPGAAVAGGYMMITNSGSEPDRLVGGSVAFAKKVEIHEMKMEGEVMKMRPLADGLEIPAGGSVALKPGGYHLMFMGLGEPLKAGERHKATLIFEKAGAVELELAVEALGKTGHHGSGSGHKGH